MRNNLVVLPLLLLFLLLPQTTVAETVLRIGSDVSVGSEQTVDGDYYGSVGPLGSTDLSGTVNGDAFLLAGDAVINGPVKADLLLLAFSAQLNGPVGDDVRVVSGETTLAGEVSGDLFIVSGSLKVLSTAHIKGNVYIFAGTADIQGQVDGGIFGNVEQLNINTKVGGNIDVKVPAGLTLGPQANIAGSVSYTSPSDLTRAQESQVTGEINKQTIPGLTGKETARQMLTPLFVLVFASLTLYLLFRRELSTLLKGLDGAIVYNLVSGAGLLIAGPVVAILLLFTVLGSLLGLMLFSALLLICGLALALSGIVAGSFVYRFVFGQHTVTLVSIIVGNIILQGLWLLPLLGPLTLVLLLTLTAGLITRAFYRSLQT